MRNLVLISFCAVLTACGVRPGQLSAPEGSDPSAYPRTYPDTQTDPKPESEKE